MPQVDKEVSKPARFSALFANCNKICYNAANNIESYEEALVKINRLTLAFEKLPNLGGLSNKKM